MTESGALPPSDVDAVVFDVDGCLTDGALHYGVDGENTKVFHARDGMGMAMLRDSGIRMAVVSGRASPIIEARLVELGVSVFKYRRMDKRRAIEELVEEWDLPASRMAAIGDDLVDVPMLRAVGFAIAPADADDRVQAVAHRVSSRPGGRGAVRELAELVLRARGDWPTMARRFELEDTP